MAGALGKATLGGLVLITALLVLLALLRRRLLRDRQVETTRDLGLRVCPTDHPHAVLGVIVCAADYRGLQGSAWNTRSRIVMPAPPFSRVGRRSPRRLRIPASRRFYKPGFSGIAVLASKLRWLQHGNIHLYVLYIALALLAMLVWMMG